MKTIFLLNLRHILNSKFNNSAKIIGMAISLVPVLLAVLYIRYEYSYDTFHNDYDKIYRIINKNALFEDYSATNSKILYYTLRNNLDGLENLTKIWKKKYLIQYNNKNYYNTDMIYTDPDFIKLFKLDFIIGNKTNFLKDKYNTYISVSLAQRIFGTKNPLGKRLTIMEIYDVRIAGVFYDYPDNSHLKTDIIISNELFGETTGTMAGLANASPWGIHDIFLYGKVKENVEIEKAESQINQLVKIHAPEKYANETKFSLEKLTDIHLNSSVRFDIAERGSTTAIVFLIIISSILLFMAISNFVNLTIAELAKRMKQICIRKLTGAGFIQVYQQLLIEIIMCLIISFIISLVLLKIILPEFNILAEKFIGLSVADILIGILLVLFLSLIVSIYPAIVCHRINPVDYLNGKSIFAKRTAFARLMTIVQIVVSIVLLFSVQMVARQLDALINTDLGYKHKGIYQVLIKNKISDERRETIRQEIIKSTGIKDISFNSFRPAEMQNSFTINTKKEKEVRCNLYSVDYNFIIFFGIKLLKGRNFNKEYKGDKETVIINRKAAEIIGYNDLEDNYIEYDGKKWKVIGVIENLADGNRKLSALPAYFFPGEVHPISPCYFTFKTNTTNNAYIFDVIKDKIAQINSNYGVEIELLEDNISTMYKEESKMSSITKSYTLCGIFISLLGILGVVVNLTERRKKEIGIRKVTGATVINIMLLFLKEMFLILGIAVLIALPLAYYILNGWLKNYAYRISINYGYFILSVLFITILLIVTIGYNIYKAGKQNPIEIIRDY